MPRYMASPKAAAVAITADRLPNSPSQGLERTFDQNEMFISIHSTALVKAGYSVTVNYSVSALVSCNTHLTDPSNQIGS